MSKFNQKLIFNKFLINTSYLYLLLLTSISLIVWTIQAVNFLDFVTEDGHGFIMYIQYSILNFPKIVSKLMPILLFIAIYVIINRYEDKNELKIFWLIGITKLEFINKILIYSLLILVILMSLTSYLVPISQKKSRTLIQESNIDFFPSLINEGTFIDTVQGLTIYVNKKNKNTYENIFMKEANKNSSRIIFAKRGELINTDNERAFKLFDGNIVNINSKNINQFDFEITKFDLKNYLTKSTTDFKLQEKNTLELLRCYYFFINLQKIKNKNLSNCNNKESILEVQSELFKRIIKPFYIIIFSLVASFLVLQNKENYIVRKYRIYIFFSGIFFIVLTEFTNTLSSKNFAVLASLIIIPIIIFFIIYFLFIKYQKS